MIKREIRSYVIREGRMTQGQKNALDLHWKSFGLDVENGLVELFPKFQESVLEIGFGMGDSLFEMARDQPACHFIGVEVHRPGVGHLLRLAAEAALTNLKIYNADTIDVIKQCMPLNSLDKIQIFFPDPWHKKKHHKRRLISVDFVGLLAPLLKPGGILHIATDWSPYADVIKDLMGGLANWQACEIPLRPVTKYERRGIRLNHEVIDLAYMKNPQQADA